MEIAIFYDGNYGDGTYIGECCPEDASLCDVQGPSRGLSEQRNKAIYFKGTREQSLNLKGTGEQRQILGTGNIENQDFDFGKQGKMPICFGGTRAQVPALGGPYA